VKHDQSFAREFACLLGIVIAFPVVASAQADGIPKPCAHAQLSESAEVRGYVFKAYEDTEGDVPGCVRVFLHGKLVQKLATDEALTYRLGQPADPVNKIPHVPDGSDLTGNGRPDMMVTSWSGGAHCCFTHYIFELEPKLRLIAALDDGDTDLGHFEDLDHNGRYFYITNEIWSYWPASFAGSVSHKVILKWDKGRFRLDLGRMRYAAPTPEQWKEALKDVDDVVDDRPSLACIMHERVSDELLRGKGGSLAG